jgi:hypothetical protein
MLWTRLRQIASTLAAALILGGLSVAPASAYSIVAEWHWSANPPIGKLPYCFVNGTSDIAGDGEQQAIRNAMNRWEDAAPRIEFVKFGCSLSPPIRIKWAIGSHGDSTVFDGVSPAPGTYDLPGGYFAHAAPPNDGDIHFDEAETWTLSERSCCFGQPLDLETVALHELGHALGLGYSESENAIMYEMYWGSHRYLSPDDVAGVQAMYTDIR